MENKAKIITVAGKGGVGKTSICACIVRLLAEKYPDKKILAIDADPAVGLSVALGVDVKLTLDDIRMSIVDSVENGETREALELLSEARFRIFDALVEMPGFAFLAIGRPESSGCYCKVNSYLKEVIGILANSFDYVVIDGEAGIEQIQRPNTRAHQRLDRVSANASDTKYRHTGGGKPLYSVFTDEQRRALAPYLTLCHRSSLLLFVASIIPIFQNACQVLLHTTAFSCIFPTRSP